MVTLLKKILWKLTISSKKYRIILCSATNIAVHVSFSRRESSNNNTNNSGNKQHKLIIAMVTVCSYITSQLGISNEVPVHPTYTSLHTHENQYSKQRGKPQGMQAMLFLQKISNVWFLKKQQANNRKNTIKTFAEQLMHASFSEAAKK
jgi:hypothetical protein